MNRENWLAFGILILILSSLTILPLVDPLEVDLVHRLAPPLSPGHPLGTDDLGRDLLSRMLHGLQTTLLVSIVATLAALSMGSVAGGIAGSRPGSILDLLIQWVGNLLLSLPLLLVMAAALSVTTPSIGKAYTVLACLLWVQPARVVRAEVARRRGLGYVLAARALGLHSWQILVQKLLPQSIPAAATLSLSYLPEVIALEAGLSFMGLGIRPPAPGIGKMIFDGLPYLSSAWWVSGLPAILLFLVIIAINVTISRKAIQATSWM